MARTPNITDDEIRSRLRDADDRGLMLTAVEVGVPAARLRKVDGVVVAGHKQTGKQGRPALLFTLEG